MDPGEFDVLVRRRPEDGAWAEWLRLGATMDSTVGELARELVLPGEVPERCGALKQMGDAKKWDVIEGLRGKYQGLLQNDDGEAGLVEGQVDGHLAHLEMLRGSMPAGAVSVQEVILIGIVELDRASREAIAKSGVKATALVFGPEDEGRWLDNFGCVRGDVVRQQIALRGDCIEFAEDMKDGANRAVGRIAAWTAEQKTLAPHDVSVCAPEPEIGAELLLAARNVDGLQFHDASGEEIGRASVVKLIASAAEHAREGTAESLAKFVKRPEVERWITARIQLAAKWLTEVDACAIRSPGTPADELEGETGAVAAGANQLLGVLAAGAGAKTALSEQLDGVIALIERAFGDEEPGEREAEALEFLAAAISELRIGANLIGRISGWRAMELLLEAVGEARTASPSRRGEVEVLGWLEAAVDRAPFVAVVGLNEGMVPKGRVEDSLLPEGVRGALGMATGRTRAERDAFLLEGMLRSREKAGGVWAICAKKDGEGNPLRPSRLLFRCGDDEAVGRIERMVSDVPEPVRFHAVSAKAKVEEDPENALGVRMRMGFPVAPLHEIGAPKSVRATAFKEYLRSPYVFFLKQVAKLEEMEEPSVEADQRLMGTVIHDVLREFGRGEARAEQREERIREWVLEKFETRLSEVPVRRASAVREVQIEVAKRRLRTFARVQAAHAADGWTIEETEWVTPKPVEIAAPSGRMLLTGRIDRIDVRRGAGEEGQDEWLVLDYKTGDTGKAPEKTHFKSKQWADLQLPLYVYMLRMSDLAPKGAKAGYFLLPKKSDDGGVKMVDWDATTFAEAEALAVQIVEDVLNKKFELGDDPYEEGAIARLCGVTLIEADEEGEE
jgi:ATP-dependent helicase/nuclease subunit B